MKYHIQCKTNYGTEGWHSFASADELIVAQTIQNTYVDRNEDFQYRILNLQNEQLMS